ncbi:MAG: GIY-YIG nuclease family protein [Caldilineaceae bacterium]|nr:GIY-YIG nuclease family protein [Caldilineaceae bacterium]
MITIVGTAGVQGVYLLRIALERAITLAFGRFAGGRSFALPAGEYLYVGSAMGKRGATTLAGRLLRHATRCPPNPAQRIRNELETCLAEAALAAKMPTQKRCHWHIDYLLEQRVASLRAIYALRTGIPVEALLARRLIAAAETSILIPHLGAGDDRRATHLLRIDAAEVWWQTLPTLLQEIQSTIQRQSDRAQEKP